MLGTLGDVQLEPGSADFLLMDRAVVDTINGFENQELFLRGLVRWLGFPIARSAISPDSVGTAPASIRSAGWSSLRSPASPPTACGRCAPRSGWRSASRRSGLLFVIYSVVSFLFVQHTVAGWTSIMAAIAILGAAQLLVLGIIGEYVGRILRETRRRPSYVVAETEADGSSEARASCGSRQVDA